MGVLRELPSNVGRCQLRRTRLGTRGLTRSACSRSLCGLIKGRVYADAPNCRNRGLDPRRFRHEISANGSGPY